ncbi:MAG: TraB/GumN family protein, partial [Paracoccaceae bacterium]
ECPVLRHLSKLIAFVLLCQPVQAECVGQNLLEAMPEAARAAMQARTDAAPFAQGNFWRASKGGQEITIIGTYHLGDPRHAATLQVLRPHIEAAATLLVEAGPEEEAKLMAQMTEDPSIMLITDGPSLMEQLPPDEWAMLVKAMAERQIPGFMAAKFQPWYISMLLSVPPCAIAAMTEKEGLDFTVIETAEAAGVPVQALEPFDTVFRLLGAIPKANQIEMVQTALVMEVDAASTSITLADAYFAENSRVFWELMQEQALTLPGYTPERVAEEFAVMEEALINARNRSWIPVLEDAATEGPVFAAFGALHLAGEEGVLNLLEQQGWTLERLPLQ